MKLERTVYENGNKKHARVFEYTKKDWNELRRDVKKQSDIYFFLLRTKDVLSYQLRRNGQILVWKVVEEK